MKLARWRTIEPASVLVPIFHVNRALFISLFLFLFDFAFLSSQSSRLLLSYKPILRAPCLCYVATKMATTVRKFPVIKEVRTFLVEGVGSGGDYHNVRHRLPWPATKLTPLNRSKGATG